MPARTRVLSVTEESIVSCGLETLINAEESMDFVASACDGVAGLDLILEQKPDVVIMDVDLPVYSAFEIAASLQVHNLPVKIILYASHAPDAYVRNCLATRCAGYVLRNSHQQAIVLAVQAVMAGNQYFSAAIRERIDAARKDGEPDEEVRLGFEALTARQFEVVLHLAQGLTVNEAAAVMGIRPRTADNHATKAKKILGIRDRATLVRRAFEEGVLASNSPLQRFYTPCPKCSTDVLLSLAARCQTERLGAQCICSNCGTQFKPTPQMVFRRGSDSGQEFRRRA